MKWLFWILLLINLGYFGANNYQAIAQTVKKEEVAQPVEQQEVEPEVIEVAQCLYLDFANDRALENAKRRLLADSVALTDISYKSVTSSEFWVVAGPFANTSAAQAELNALLAQGVDGLLVTSGEMANYISFGIFNSNQDARAQLASLQVSGVVAAIERKDEVSYDKWLKVLEQSVYKVEAEWLARLKSDHSLTKNEKKSCN